MVAEDFGVCLLAIFGRYVVEHVLTSILVLMLPTHDDMCIGPIGSG
jgi:hypothetical protein